MTLLASRPPRIGLVGFGHWGSRLARAIAAEPTCRLAGIVDIDAGRRAAARAAHDGIAVHETIDALGDIEALAIAVYPASQPDIARAGLARGLHVLAEKPLALGAADAAALADLAGRAGRVLLVDCTPVYSPLTDAVRACLADGSIGAPTRYHAQRTHGGRRQPGIDVLFDLAVHDLAVLDASLAISLLSIAATSVPFPRRGKVARSAGRGMPGQAQSQSDESRLVEHPPSTLRAPSPSGGGDVIIEAHIDLRCAGGLQASIDVSWTGTEPVRRTVIDGTRGHLCRDDGAVSVVLTPDGAEAQTIDLPDRDDEPLRRMVRHFADCIMSGTPPRTDARVASRHIGWLEMAARSIAAAGRPIDLASGAFL